MVTPKRRAFAVMFSDIDSASEWHSKFTTATNSYTSHCGCHSNSITDPDSTSQCSAEHYGLAGDFGSSNCASCYDINENVLDRCKCNYPAQRSAKQHPVCQRS